MFVGAVHRGIGDATLGVGCHGVVTVAVAGTGHGAGAGIDIVGTCAGTGTDTGTGTASSTLQQRGVTGGARSLSISVVRAVLVKVRRCGGCVIVIVVCTCRFRFRVGL